MSNVLLYHHNKTDHTFDIKNAILIKGETIHDDKNNQRVAMSSTVNECPGPYDISPLLAELLLLLKVWDI